MDYVSRDGWGSRYAKPTSKIGSVYGIGVHYTFSPAGHDNHDLCDDDMRVVQRAHVVGNGWSDIAYSWLVCRHGVIFEGRGWGVRTAANGTNFGNEHYHAVCVITPGPISDDAKRAVNQVIAEHGRRYQRNEVKGHRDFKATGCPGDEIYAWVKAGRPEGAAPAPQPEPGPAPAPGTGFAERAWHNPTVEKGSSNSHYVRIAQAFMIAHNAWEEGGKVDGQFGQLTEDHLRWWQAHRPPLGATGYVDGDDWAWWAGEPPVLKQGDTGHYVRQMQALMIAHTAWSEGGKCDGIFGPGTAAALKAWQGRTGYLAADGICGPATWAHLAGLTV